MFCNKCGNSVPDGMRFCHKCGSKLPVLTYQREPHAQESKNIQTFIKSEGNTKEKSFRFCNVGSIALVISILIIGIVAIYRFMGTAIKDKAESVYYLEAFDSYNNYLGSGSGFLISTTDIATNYHVIEGAAKIVISSADNKEKITITTVIAYNIQSDLAILRSPSPLKAEPLKLADSDPVQQGDRVYAIGYPLGLSNTLSDGIVSARYIENGVDYLQITAAISPGSSGGALLNTKGQVVGVVCAYFEGGQNLNVAIASNDLQNLYSEKNDIKSLSVVP